MSGTGTALKVNNNVLTPKMVATASTPSQSYPSMTLVGGKAAWGSKATRQRWELVAASSSSGVGVRGGSGDGGMGGTGQVVGRGGGGLKLVARRHRCHGRDTTVDGSCSGIEDRGEGSCHVASDLNRAARRKGGGKQRVPECLD